MRVFAIVAFAVAVALLGCDDRSPKQPAGQSANMPKSAASADQTGDGMLPAGTFVGILAVPTTRVGYSNESAVTRSCSVADAARCSGYVRNSVPGGIARIEKRVMIWPKIRPESLEVESCDSQL